MGLFFSFAASKQKSTVSNTHVTKAFQRLLKSLCVTSSATKQIRPFSSYKAKLFVNESNNFLYLWLFFFLLYRFRYKFSRYILTSARAKVARYGDGGCDGGGCDESGDLEDGDGEDDNGGGG